MDAKKSKLNLIAMLLFLSMTFVCKADVSELVNENNLVGKAKMEYLWWDVYDIHLYAPGGIYRSDTVYALELTYLMSFSSEQIAKRSIKEIKNLGFNKRDTLEYWREWLIRSLPNVQEGERLLGIKTKNNETLFYKNSTLVAKMDDAEFTRYFFSIWLHERTSEPKLRKQLLGVDYND